jgi:hypothetical protein
MRPASRRLVRPKTPGSRSPTCPRWWRLHNGTVTASSSGIARDHCRGAFGSGPLGAGRGGGWRVRAILPWSGQHADDNDASLEGGD